MWGWVSVGKTQAWVFKEAEVADPPAVPDVDAEN